VGSWLVPVTPPRIRAATPDDAPAILRVVDAAFSDATRDAHKELDIVRDTWERRAGPDRIELVAEVEDGGGGSARGTLVGHVLAATGDLDGQPVAGVAPLGVIPARQRAGVGRALMDALVAEAEQRRWPLLLLLGDPAYYGRFGFAPAASLGIHYAPAGPGNPHFMARRVGDASAALPRGEYRYCWEL
jgi:putative acetyltransferase